MTRELVLCCFILTAPLCGQGRPYDDPGLRRFERELEAVLRWEILWNDSPAGFVAPPGRQARFALNKRGNSLSYCSHDVGVCVRYRIDPNRNWEGETSTKCDGSESDEDAVLAFIGVGAKEPGSAAGSRRMPELGSGGLTGAPSSSAGVTWTATLNPGGREEIVRRYRQLRPPEIEGIRQTNPILDRRAGLA